VRFAVCPQNKEQDFKPAILIAEAGIFTKVFVHTGPQRRDLKNIFLIAADEKRLCCGTAFYREADDGAVENPLYLAGSYAQRFIRFLPILVAVYLSGSFSSSFQVV